MLDAFIIDKIRRERESNQRDPREQLRIDMPRMPSGPGAPGRGGFERNGPPAHRRDEDEAEDPRDRGFVIVDFTL
jgi:hypothetical protein